MKKDNRKKQVEQMIFAGIENIFRTQDTLSFDEFAIVTLEGLMLLEREEYLKSAHGNEDIGNGVYLRNFKSLRKNSLFLRSSLQFLTLAPLTLTCQTLNAFHRRNRLKTFKLISLR